MVIRSISLFAGIGGLDLAWHTAIECRGGAGRTLCYVEREAYAAASLVARMAEERLDQAPIWSDITTFNPKPWRGAVDWILASPPCQPHSVAGNRKGTGDERWVWQDVERIIGECDPSWVFIENVRGSISSGALKVWLESLAGLGFDAEWICIRASDVGAPHKRDRLFLLGRSQRAGSMADTHSRGLEGIGMGGHLRPSQYDSAQRDNADRCDGEIDGQLESQHVPNADSGAVRVRAERSQPDSPVGGNAESIHLGGGSFDWPPGPRDYDAWQRVAKEQPSALPAVRGDVDGVSPEMVYRSDRLRSCGNAVVPLQGAVALSLLLDRFSVEAKR